MNKNQLRDNAVAAARVNAMDRERASISIIYNELKPLMERIEAHLKMIDREIAAEKASVE